MKKIKKRVIAYVHSHWDREWYRPFEEFRLRLIEVFDSVLEELENGNLPVFYFDAQTAALEDYLVIRPEKTELVKKLISEKKLYIGPFYCSTDSLLTSLECMIRNLSFGIKKSVEFGCSDFIGYLADTFGHSPSMSYILDSFSIDKAMMWRGLGDLSSELLWEKTYVTNMVQGYFQDYFSSQMPIEKKACAIKNYIEKIAKRSKDIILLPIGADHLAVPVDLSNEIKKINSYLDYYEIELGTPFDYFDAVKKEQREAVFGEFLDNSLTFILPGVYSSRIYLKQQNAKLQWALCRISEPLQALENCLKLQHDRQSQIDYAYKLLIKNHAHDSIYGCSVDDVHRENMTRFENVSQVVRGIEKRCVRDFSDDSDEISLINLSNYDYSGIVKVQTTKKLPKKYNPTLVKKTKGFSDEKLYNITQIPITEDYGDIFEYLIDVKNIPSFSFKKVEERDMQIENYLHIDENSIENKYIRLEVQNKKTVLLNKQTGEKYVDFINITDRADIGDSYNFGGLKGDTRLYAELKSFKTSKIDDKALTFDIVFSAKIPVISTAKGRSKQLKAHDFSLKATLYNNSKNLEINTKFVNKSKNHILQIEFKLQNPVKTTVSEDMSFLNQRNFNSDFDIDKKIPAKKGCEIKPNTAPFQRFVFAQGVGFITKGLNEYEVFKNTLSITLLRATGVISNPKNPTRGTPAGPPLECPELQSFGDNSAEIAISFVEKPFELYKQAEEFYGAIVPVFADFSGLKIIEISDDNVLVYAIKNTKDKNLAFRLVNVSDKEIKTSIKTDLSYNSLYASNPLEENLKEIPANLTFVPHEIKTIILG
ncbi:MAG: glycoside hydrolase family 38 C-terminal domain-containing protein [Candidatus Gastranaerophilales bacterium]|nr:glycoside hydrolase family 38 C-terminal domain-containing protein [Candidatus Gastranaerophilales bacterium]